MVAIVHQSSSLRNAIQYNEQKVRLGGAEILHSGNYPKDTELLSFTERFNRLKKQTALNTKVKVNTVHISLNFPDEDKKRLSDQILRSISDAYMQKIGFGNQPYLVYRHKDAGHEHVHIVTTNIQNNGKAISLHNLAKGRSLFAAKTIEKDFKLTVATNKHRQAYQLTPVNALKIQYGKFGSKRAITNVLDHVLTKYKFESLHELNAVLKLYNVMADGGSSGTRIQKNGGLVYRILDANGTALGIPVKASLIYNKPTLKFLQQQCTLNRPLKVRHLPRVKNVIDSSLIQNRGNISLDSFTDQLKQKGIDTVLRRNNAGRLYGITYVDHKTGCIFNGSQLGKAYAATGLLQRLTGNVIRQKLQKHTKNMVQKVKHAAPVGHFDAPLKPWFKPIWNLSDIQKDCFVIKTLDILTAEEYQGTLSLELQRDIRRRKRRRQSLS